MKITSIKPIGKHEVYDIAVTDDEHYILENGVISHNSGLIYSANQAFIIGKSQVKEGTDIVGYNFTINVEKSRFVREKSKLPFTVTYENGIMKYSGLLDIALELGTIQKVGVGWYSRVIDGVLEDKKYRAKQTLTKEFWDIILNSDDFKDKIKKRYQLGAISPENDLETDNQELAS
jgi:hypothetical protein